MKRIIWIGMFVLAAGRVSYAQEMVMVQETDLPKNTILVEETKSRFEFTALTQREELSQISDDMVDSHFLGRDIAKKIFLLNKSYSYKEPVAPGNSATKTIFRKPVIYNSVKKIERNMKNKVKSGELTLETAQFQFNKVLDVALNIININTDKFESRLSSADNANELLEIYVHEVSLRYVN
jgi:hypothetical protein